MQRSDFSRTVAALCFASFCVLGAACETTRKTRELVKAKPATLTPFLEDPARLEMDGATGPFHAVWASATPEQRERSKARTEIYIAPVVTSYLRPITKSMSRRQEARWNRRRPVAETAEQLRTAFVDAFQSSPNPRYRLVAAPTPNSVTLTLSLVELDPTSVTGNAVKKAASVVLTPAVGLAGGLTKGCVAIEGQLRDSAGGWLLLQFADKEHDKITFWTLRDFQPYAHTGVAITEWATQYEELSRNPRWREEIADSPAVTLKPW